MQSLLQAFNGALAPPPSPRANKILEHRGEMSMRIVRLVCLLALLAGVSLCRLAGANAEVSPDVRQACTPDAMRLCSEFIPDVAKITACMKAKHAQLSAGCLTAMRGGKGEPRHVARHEGRHERYESRHETRHEARHEGRHRRMHERCDKFTHMCG
jgi:hypothetical protein